MSSATTLTNTSINIPQLLAVALVGFLAIRWFLRPTPPTSAAGAGSSRSSQLDVSKIDQVSAMFPQLDRRAIAWDLQRNGHNVSATTERVLAGRGLDQPPPSFQPNLPAAPSAASSPSTTSGNRPTSKTSQGQDLISRYGLQNRVNGKGKEAEPSEEKKRSAWSADKTARAEGLKSRREEMILTARRKMLEKERDTAQ
ncbi:hypothetical protein AMS68_006555 [Peltaster fructicola]|uniref:Coupling of ubiquitin conjugation to ER degradation protein 1 n=1 Tax=Peltaster fructicola TaxID=286661 RepID=A0A6H0Y2G0_9PEZI|nr:hypothetical protein AMS68_006555 [Peltaster fructicola]